VGDTVGDLVGAEVGDLVGDLVGTKVGDAVGEEVGERVMSSTSMVVLSSSVTSKVPLILFSTSASIVFPKSWFGRSF